MKLEELGLQIGDSLQLQPLSEAEARYVVRVIGYVPNKSLLTTMPFIEPGRALQLKDKQPVILRFAIHSAVTGFRTTVLAVRAIPYAYLHLAMPDDIEMLKVRQALRVKTTLKATVTNSANKSQAIGAQIIDLSPAGAGVLGMQPFGELGNRISITFDTKIGEMEKILVLPGIIRSISDSDERVETSKFQYSHGIQITDVDEDDMIALHAYVYQKMLKQIHVLA